MLERNKKIFLNYSKLREKCGARSEIDLASYYEQMRLIFENYYCKYFGNNKDIRILEIGCSNGGMTRVLYKKGYKNIIGIDMCPTSIEIAKKKNRNITYICGDAKEYLENSNEKFDLIYSRAVFEHIEKDSINEIMGLMKKSLNNSGGVLIDVPNMDWIWASHERYMDFTHECGFTSESLTEILRAYFPYISITYEDVALMRGIKLKNRIARRILLELYNMSGIPVSCEKLFSQDIIAFGSNKFIK